MLENQTSARVPIRVMKIHLQISAGTKAAIDFGTARRFGSNRMGSNPTILGLGLWYIA
jgi:hypothetical protein